MKPKTLRYSVLVIDPPWSKRKGGIRKCRPNQGRSFTYKTMNTQQIFHLLDNDIFSITDKDHCVFMWTTEQHLIECEFEMQKRGYKRHCRFIWNKTNGVCPAFTVRYSHEFLIWYYKGKMIPISKEMAGKYTTVFTERSREHSRKPEISYQMVSNLYPNAYKMDVFSRERRQGYDQFGDQIDYFSALI